VFLTGEIYQLAPGVRARKEKFGLLFYNSRDAKLTFLKSGDLFDVVCDPPGSFRLSIDCNNSDGAGKIKRLLELLLNRGLVVETRSGI
jgi:putative mycofactocin binding protein MftB